MVLVLQNKTIVILRIKIITNYKNHSNNVQIIPSNTELLSRVEEEQLGLVPLMKTQ